MLEGTERLLEVPYSLAMSRSRQGLLPRLPAVCQGLGPYLTLQGMVRQALDLLSHPIPHERFDGVDDAGMERSPPLQQKAAIGHLVGEGMLEGILVLGKEACLVEEFGGVEMR